MEKGGQDCLFLLLPVCPLQSGWHGAVCPGRAGMDWKMALTS